MTDILTDYLNEWVYAAIVFGAIFLIGCLLHAGTWVWEKLR